MLTNIWYPKMKNKLKNIFQNNKKETLLWEAQRPVQKGSLVKMLPLKRFRTVLNYLHFVELSTKIYKERFRTVSWHISWGCVFTWGVLLVPTSVRQEMHRQGFSHIPTELFFAHVLSMSRLLSWKFGRKNFQNWFLKTFELLRLRGLQMFANCFTGRQATNSSEKVIWYIKEKRLPLVGPQKGSTLCKHSTLRKS